VDDVFTTGATLVAAASALAGEGAESVDGITFARALEPVG
jgi:predicted amidophosphoribosyltransferase